MRLFLDGIIIVMLLLLASQDWKDRAVSWYWFPLLVLSAGIKAYLSNLLQPDWLLQIGLSFSFLIINLIVLFLYLYLKYGVSTIKSGGLIGIGDLLFFLLLIFFGSFIHYLLFFTGSLAFSLLFWLAFRRYSKYKTVPLAGLQALCLAVLWLYVSCTSYNTYSDDAILSFLFI